MAAIGGPKKLTWTSHSRSKMRQYHFSEQRVRRVLHSPLRIEEGIAEGTIAFMQRSTGSKRPYEIWVMVKDTKDARSIISAWRYPGETKLGTPLPANVIRELRSSIF